MLTNFLLRIATNSFSRCGNVAVLLTTDSQNTDYNDLDGDGYFGGIGGDCDDNNWSVNPGAIETLDGVDNDCDGLVDYEDDNAVFCGNGIVDASIGETCDDGNDRPISMDVIIVV